MKPDAMINDLFRRKVCWLDASGPGEDIAISSRIRFARNITGQPFPINADDETLEHLGAGIAEAITAIAEQQKFNICNFPMENVSELDRQFLLERHLISREMMHPRHGAKLITNREQGTFVMIHEEDHLRMQILAPGFQLQSIFQRMDHLDDLLSEHLSFAFDSRLGYLTACPTNLGTGMRASVMLHLPGLTLSKQLEPVVNGVSKLGLTVRGLFGEGSKNEGNIVQISNRSSLGETCEEIIRHLEATVRRIILHEQKARSILLSSQRAFLLNHISRAYGLLTHSYMISGEDALNALSALRMGVDMGMFNTVSVEVINKLFLLIQTAHLQKFLGRNLDSQERDTERATLLREQLS